MFPATVLMGACCNEMPPYASRIIQFLTVTLRAQETTIIFSFTFFRVGARNVCFLQSRITSSVAIVKQGSFVTFTSFVRKYSLPRSQPLVVQPFNSTGGALRTHFPAAHNSPAAHFTSTAQLEHVSVASTTSFPHPPHAPSRQPSLQETSFIPTVSLLQ